MGRVSNEDGGKGEVTSKQQGRTGGKRGRESAVKKGEKGWVTPTPAN